ncbi:MAG: hypothetical protein Q4C96_06235 [Planctomycetia bacterium]|nr:hypothetical protein [Planctomycetia bacterium]
MVTESEFRERLRKDARRLQSEFSEEQHMEIMEVLRKEPRVSFCVVKTSERNYYGKRPFFIISGKILMGVTVLLFLVYAGMMNYTDEHASEETEVVNLGKTEKNPVGIFFEDVRVSTLESEKVINPPVSMFSIFSFPFSPEYISGDPYVREDQENNKIFLSCMYQDAIKKVTRISDWSPEIWKKNMERDMSEAEVFDSHVSIWNYHYYHIFQMASEVVEKSLSWIRQKTEEKKESTSDFDVRNGCQRYFVNLLPDMLILYPMHDKFPHSLSADRPAGIFCFTENASFQSRTKWKFKVESV